MAVKYLAKYAGRVVANGYDICFIRPGEKRPFGKNWEAKYHGMKTIASAIENGRSNFGVGIKTADTPLVDIDCYDKKIVSHMIRFTEDLCGKALRRVGLAPKTGLLYRTKKPFRKVQSKMFVDDEGRLVRLEVLGEGQQFVAFHIHPDTGRPYEWLTDSPLEVDAEDLETIERDDAMEIAAEFERLARDKGWQEKSTLDRRESKGSGKRYDADPFATDKSKIELGTEQLLKELHRVPGAEDHDTWFQIGMALYHQYDGDDEGLTLWHEWSAEAHNYDADALDTRWPSFGIEGKGREPVTARLILKLAKKETERLAGEELSDVKKDIGSADSLEAIQAVMDRVKAIAFPNLLRENLVLAIKDQAKTVTGQTMPIGVIRKACAYENPENRSKPVWLRDWVYVQHDETFYHQRTRQSLTTKAFDLSYGRFMLSKKDVLEGAATPEHSATHVALNRFQIPVVANKMYMPGEGEFFEANKLQYVNSYSDATVPEIPDRLSKKQLRLVSRVERHLEHLFANERDRQMLMSWLAYIVQTGGKINWSPVVQGVENDGKSFFGRLAVSVLGGENVSAINGETIAEKYTPWAEGSQFCMIEEVRLHGMDRFAIINKMKTYIANDMVMIRRMATDVYKVVNTVNYFLTTNHKDGIPVNSNSSRFFPMFSRWQNKIHLDKFNKENPDYYDKLHEVLTPEYAGALRKWLMDYKLHPEFHPIKRATASSSMKEMQFLNQTDEDEAFHEILESDEPGLSYDLVDSAALSAEMADRGAAVPYGLAWKRLLSENGLTYLGRVKIDGRSPKFWSRTPEKFLKNGKIDTAAIREALDPI